MICEICKVEYDRSHLRCMELLIDYSGNTVVTDVLNKTPEVFDFLFNILKAQCTNHTRFTLLPTHFTNADNTLNIGRFTNAIRAPVKKQYTDDMHLYKETSHDTYLVLRFMILSNPLELLHVSFTTWDKFKVKWNDAIEKKFERTDCKPEYLYHGSSLYNWQNIIHNGIKVTSGTSWMTTGAAYGNGIYLSDTLNVSYAYSAQTRSIVIGVYEIYEAKKYMKTTSYYVVPTEDLLLLRYLLYIPDTHAINFILLDKSLRADWNKKSDNKAAALTIKQAKTEKRIMKEIKLIEENGGFVEIINASQLKVIIKSKVYDIKIPHMFPFDGPYINDVKVENWNVTTNLINAVDVKDST